MSAKTSIIELRPGEIWQDAKSGITFIVIRRYRTGTMLHGSFDRIDVMYGDGTVRRGRWARVRRGDVFVNSLPVRIA